MTIHKDEHYLYRLHEFKELAYKLRSEGLSYKEIRAKVPVSKSTISLWCRSIPLTKKQQSRLRGKRGSHSEGIRAIQKMFWQRRCDAFEKGRILAKRLTNNSRFVAGLMLYWGEGRKKCSTMVANSDPFIIRFMVRWFAEFFEVSPKSFVIQLHLHSGLNESEAKLYWSKLTGVPLSNFHKSYIKQQKTEHRKKLLYNGTIQLRVKKEGSTYLLFTIFGAIAEYLRQTLGEKIRREDWMSRMPYA